MDQWVPRGSQKLCTEREQSCKYRCMTSIVEEFKVTKFRQFLMMRDSNDAKVREARASRDGQEGVSQEDSARGRVTLKAW